jgi:hypothetical protein
MPTVYLDYKHVPIHTLFWFIWDFANILPRCPPMHQIIV